MAKITLIYVFLDSLETCGPEQFLEILHTHTHTHTQHTHTHTHHTHTQNTM